jgi:hypothetical protein
MEKSITKITQYFPCDSFGTQTIEIIGNELVYNYTNLFSSSLIKINLKEISLEYSPARFAYDNWDDAAWFFVCVAIPFLILTKSFYSFIPILIAIVLFLFKFIK